MRRSRFTTVLLLIWIGLFTSAWASKHIVVDLTNQIAIAYQDGKVKFYGRISSGKPGRETPTGHFYVREKDIDHVSNLWPKPNGGAKMHYMLRITRDGIAMHLGNTPDYPASHGCIRMQNGFAQRMYAWADKYTKVDIIGKAPAHSPAVHLPAYARSKRILQRSIGGGTRGPLAALSSNPKDHAEDLSHLSLMSQTSLSSSRRTRNRRDSHPDPLLAVSGHPKRTPASTRKTQKAKRTKKHRVQDSRRSRTRSAARTSGRSSVKKRRTRSHRRKKHTKRHPNPLKSIAGN